MRGRRRARMATTNDTDPQREEPVHDDPTHASRDEANAAALLAGLAESAQPTQDVAETEGHVAAAYAAAPHRPPRANEKTVENPAVFINATVPLPPPSHPSSGHQRLGPPAPPVVSMKGDPTVLGGARLFEALQNQTDPGERAKNQMRIYFAAIGGVVIAGLITITVLLVQRAPSNDVPPSASATGTNAPPVITSGTSAPVVVESSAPAPTVATSPAALPSTTTPTTSTTTAPKASAHGRPHGSSTAPRPSGNFAEPDRHL